MDGAAWVTAGKVPASGTADAGETAAYSVGDLTDLADREMDVAVAAAEIEMVDTVGDLCTVGKEEMVDETVEVEMIFAAAAGEVVAADAAASPCPQEGVQRTDILLLVEFRAHAEPVSRPNRPKSELDASLLKAARSEKGLPSTLEDDSKPPEAVRLPGQVLCLKKEGKEVRMTMELVCVELAGIDVLKAAVDPAGHHADLAGAERDLNRGEADIVHPWTMDQKWRAGMSQPLLHNLKAAVAVAHVPGPSLGLYLDRDPFLVPCHVPDVEQRHMKDPARGGRGRQASRRTPRLDDEGEVSVRVMVDDRLGCHDVNNHLEVADTT